MANDTVYLGEVNTNVSKCCTVNGRLTAGIHENWVSEVIAVTATQGKFVWSSRSIPESYLSTPTAAGNTVYIIGAYSLYALNAQTGKIRWVWVNTEPLASATPIVAVA